MREHGSGPPRRDTRRARQWRWKHWRWHDDRRWNRYEWRRVERRYRLHPQQALTDDHVRGYLDALACRRVAQHKFAEWAGVATLTGFGICAAPQLIPGQASFAPCI